MARVPPPVLFLLGCLVCSIWGECEFIPQYSYEGSDYAGVSTADLKACFESVAFDEERRQKTLASLMQLTDLYVFTDIAKNSPSPYTVEVDLQAELETLATASFLNDWEFHNELNELFSRLQDPHTRYVPPTPYMSAVHVRPFILKATNNAGVLEVTAEEESEILGSLSWSEFSGFDVSSYVGKKITSINGVGIEEWLQALGDRSGRSKDAGSRLNYAISRISFLSDFSEIDFPPTVETYVFEGVSEPVNIPTRFITLPCSGESDFANGIPPDSKRLQKREEFFQLQKSPLLDVLLTTRKSANTRRGLKKLSKPSRQRQTSWLSDPSRVLSCVSFYPTSDSSRKSQLMLISSFLPPSDMDLSTWATGFHSTLNDCIEAAQEDGAQEVLIDVTGNSGGVVCAAFGVSYQLIEGWDYTENNDLWGYFDLRKTALQDSLFAEGLIDPADHLDPDVVPTVPLNSSSFFTSGVEYTRGGVAGNYSRRVFYPSSCLEYFKIFIPARVITAETYERITMLTDGSCGSACSLMLAQLFEKGKISIVTMGGIINQEMDFTSFIGGNVEDWSDLAKTSANLQPLPTTASASFTHREYYLDADESSLPREFLRIPGTVHIDRWYSLAEDHADIWLDAAVAAWVEPTEETQPTLEESSATFLSPPPPLLLLSLLSFLCWRVLHE